MTRLTATTIVAEVVSADGTAAWTDAWAGPGYRSFQATPPHVFDDHQPGEIPICIRHDGPLVGYVDYLEEGLGYGNGGLFAVGVIEGVGPELVDGLVMCSAEIRANAMARMVNTTEWRNGQMRSSTKVTGSMNATKAELAGVALVDQTASLTTTKVRAFAGDYRDVCDWSMMKAWRPPPILDRAKAAATTNLRYNRPPAVRIHRPDDGRYLDHRYAPRPAGRSSGKMIRMPDGSMAELVYRPGGRILSVRSA